MEFRHDAPQQALVSKLTTQFAFGMNFVKNLASLVHL
jgi:hypothetical protein